MSEIKLPPLPDGINCLMPISAVMENFARQAVELNRPKVPEDAKLDEIERYLRGYPFNKVTNEAAEAIAALRQRVENELARSRSLVNDATVAIERADRAEADLAAANKEIEALIQWMHKIHTTDNLSDCHRIAKEAIDSAEPQRKPYSTW